MERTELPFRVCVVALWLLGLGVRVYYQRKVRGVTRTGARGVRRDTILYYVVFASYLLPLVYALSPVLDFAHVDVPAALRWAGAVLGVGALALFASTHRALGRNWSGVVEISHRHTLVTSGPYERVRHPMYSALLATAVANALLTANWLVALVMVGATVAMYLARVRDEERLMLEYFGDAYRAYMRRTGRLLPKLWY